MSKIPVLIAIFFLPVLIAVGCTTSRELSPGADESAAGENAAAEQSEPQPRMGPGSGMMARHHAQVPAEYAGLANLVPADDDSLLRGADLYDQYCVSCHGESGMGDGLAGQHLDPSPAPIAHSSRMLGDDYLFWRISEGGSHDPFSSAMPRWQDVLEDSDRWDVINFIRALGSDRRLPGRGPRGGQTFDPALEAQRHQEMAAEGVRQGVLSQDEADAFVKVHAELDRLMAVETEERSGGMEAMQQEMLAELVEAGTIAPDAAAFFTTAHDKLLEAGLME